MNFKSRIIIGCLLGGMHIASIDGKRLISIVSIFRDKGRKLLTLSAVRKLIFPSAPWNAGNGRGLKVDETDLPVCRTLY